MRSTQDVLTHHLECFGAGDLDGIMSDYAPGSTVFTPNGVAKGLEAIRGVFAGMLAEPKLSGAAFTITQQSVDGDVAYIVWSNRIPGGAGQVGTDTLMVQGGVIVTQTFARWAVPVV